MTFSEKKYDSFHLWNNYKKFCSGHKKLNFLKTIFSKVGRLKKSSVVAGNLPFVFSAQNRFVFFELQLYFSF